MVETIRLVDGEEPIGHRWDAEAEGWDWSHYYPVVRRDDMTIVDVVAARLDTVEDMEKDRANAFDVERDLYWLGRLED